MKKDWIRDYATEAFRIYALHHEPTYDEIEKIEDAGLAADLMAVCNTITFLTENDKTVIYQSIKNVYFVDPSKPLKKGDISQRVLHLALSMPAAEKSIYRWLNDARDIFANMRGLRTKEHIKRCQ